MKTIGDHAEALWPPMMVWLAGLLFSVPTVAMVLFAVVATGWIPVGAS